MVGRDAPVWEELKNKSVNIRMVGRDAPVWEELKNKCKYKDGWEELKNKCKYKDGWARCARMERVKK
jgi:hypothetical protein